jgi:hypothetical protein
MAQSRKDKQPDDAPAPRRGWATVLGAETGLLSREAFARAGFADPTLILRWEEIAGPETAALARPIRLAGDVLTLKAEPAASVFLQHDSRALCERINAYLGRPAVTRLRFVQGALASRAKPRPRPPADRPAPQADPARKYQGPEGLKDALLKLAKSRQNTQD